METKIKPQLHAFEINCAECEGNSGCYSKNTQKHVQKHQNLQKQSTTSEMMHRRSCEDHLSNRSCSECLIKTQVGMYGQMDRQMERKSKFSPALWDRQETINIEFRSGNPDIYQYSDVQ
jgi:hypothetical protein